MADEWVVDGARITDPEILERLKAIIENESPLIVEHRSYRGASAPPRLIFDSADAFEEYFRDRTRPGDSFYIWAFEACCTDERVIARGKVPDEEGRTPRGGSY